MSDNINTSMNFMCGKEETHAPMVESAPKRELCMDELSSILAFLPQKDLAKVVNGSRSMIVVKAAVRSTTSKKVKFKDSVQKMIAVLKKAGAEKQVVKLEGLLSKEIFRNPDIMFTDKIKNKMGVKVLRWLSSLDSSILFALKANHMDVLKYFGITDKSSFIKMLIKGTRHENAYKQANKLNNEHPVNLRDGRTGRSLREKVEDCICSDAAMVFLSVKDYLAALECASMLYNLSDKKSLIEDIYNSLMGEGCTIKRVETLINLFDDAYIKKIGKHALIGLSLDVRNYCKAITTADAMTDPRERMEALDGILSVMKDRNVSLDVMKTYFQSVSSEVDGAFKPKFIDM